MPRPRLAQPLRPAPHRASRRTPAGAVLPPAALLAAAAWGAATAGAQAVRTVPGFAANTLQANDDGSTGLDGAAPGDGRIAFGFAAPINYFGRRYTGAYVNTNGNLTFRDPLRKYTPFGLMDTLDTPIIAAYFADVDTRGASLAGGDNGQGNDGNVAQPFDGTGLVTYGTGVVDGRAAFGVNWFSECSAWTGAAPGPSCPGRVGVGYYAGHTDLLNIFQLLLIDRSDVAAGAFDIEFNYDQVQWETGDESGGTAGVGDSSSRVGFANGTGRRGTFYELAGSGTPGAFLDGGPAGTALTRNSRNSGGVLGRYVFEVRSGRPDPLSPVPEPQTWVLLAGGLATLAGAAAVRRRVLAAATRPR